MKPWTDEETAILKSNYKNIGAKLLSQSLLKGKTEQQIRSRAEYLGLKRNKNTICRGLNRIHFVNNYFFSIPNNLNSYWAGFIAADGCISDTAKFSISLQDLDASHLVRFLNDVDCTRPEAAVKIRSTGYTKKDASVAQMARIHLSGMEQWKQDLFSHWSITPRKSLTLIAPNIADKELKLSYLAGLIDGDGSVRINKVKQAEILRIGICGGSNKILTWIKCLIDELVPPENRSFELAQIRKNRGNTEALEITGTRASKLAYLVRQLNLPVMPRKWGKAFDYLEQYHTNGIVTDRRTTKTEDIVKAIRIDLVNGMTRREAEQKYGVRRAEINRIASGDRWAWLNDGLEVPKTYRQPKQLPVEKVLEIRKLLDEGQKPPVIAAMMGLRPAVVRDIKNGKSYKETQYSLSNNQQALEASKDISSV
jgi:hypothetical protein